MTVDLNTLDWAARASQLRPIREEQLGTLASDLSTLKPGERVTVVTTLGRTMATGAVLSVQSDGEKSVLVKLDTVGVDQSQNFSADLYKFYVLPPETESNLSENGLAEDSPVIADPDLASNSGELPAKPDTSPPSVPVQVILPFVGYDLRWAVTIWDDIGHYGFDRAMSRHAVPELAKQTIRSMLLDKKVIAGDNDALTPEWVQAANLATPQASLG